MIRFSLLALVGLVAFSAAGCIGSGPNTTGLPLCVSDSPFNESYEERVESPMNGGTTGGNNYFDFSVSGDSCCDTFKATSIINIDRTVHSHPGHYAQLMVIIDDSGVEVFRCAIMGRGFIVDPVTMADYGDLSLSPMTPWSSGGEYKSGLTIDLQNPGSTGPLNEVFSSQVDKLPCGYQMHFYGIILSEDWPGSLPQPLSVPMVVQPQDGRANSWVCGGDLCSNPGTPSGDAPQFDAVEDLQGMIDGADALGMTFLEFLCYVNIDNNVSYSEALGAMQPAFIRGDANFDQVVNIADAISLLGHVTGGTAIDTVGCDEILDVNDDGSVNIADAMYLLGLLDGTYSYELFGKNEVDQDSDSISCEYPAGV